MTYKEVHAEINRIRKERKLSIEAFAALTDISEGTMKRSLAVPEKVSLQRLNAMAQALGIVITVELGAE
jgi:transcriptional regulator with XRE-family HTH domain